MAAYFGNIRHDFTILRMTLGLQSVLFVLSLQALEPPPPDQSQKGRQPVSDLP
jgi:hypothetical protein